MGKNDVKGFGLTSANALGDTRVCLELPAGSSQDEQAIEWCVYVCVDLQFNLWGFSSDVLK